MLTANSILSVVLSVVQVIVGLPCNALIIGVYAGRKPKTSTALLIIYRAVIDVVAATIMAPIDIVYVVTDPDSWLCFFAIILKDILSYSLLTTAVAIAYDRFVVVCTPYDGWSSKKRGIIAIVSTVSGSVLLSIGGTIAERQNDPGAICRATSHPSSMTHAWMKTAVFAASVIACLVFYWLVYITFHKHAAQGQARAGSRLSTIREGRKRRRLFGKREQTRESVTSKSSRSVHVQIEPAPPTTTMGFIHSENQSEAKYSLNPQKESTPTEIENTEMWLKPRLFSIHGSEPGQRSLKYTQNTRPETSRASTSKGRRNRFSESSAVSPMSAINMPCKESRSISVSALISSTTVNIHRNSRPRTADISNTTANRDAVNERLDQEHKTTVMMFAVTFFLIVSWIPAVVFYHVGKVDYGIDDMDDGIEHQNELVFLATRLPQLNHFVSCFIYALTSAEFRREVHSKIRKLVHCGRQQENQLEV
ncbi:uncharacterized protein LOC105447195 [Strongylocentrotus purpuratus]|uniref:G-protein coupled receptors family 1 profile domain-containing protein n=1 Tax=Strongylocentrotus purpuratus TaxID=7668 RepID=A0A7M7HK27_STRPU|nr:uncharacterized protein LOC105447195 [Strongylocentrotus purpuratus]